MKYFTSRQCHSCQKPLSGAEGLILLTHAMGSAKRASAGGLIYHVPNQAKVWWSSFAAEDVFAAFEQNVFQAGERHGFLV